MNILITDGTATLSNNNVVVTGETFKITNADFYQQEFSLTESLCSESNLIFGSCEAAELKFKFCSTSIADLTGKTIKAYCYDNGTIQQLGVYTIESDTATADKTIRDVTAYDAMKAILNVDVASWYNTAYQGIGTKHTVGELRRSLLTYLGIEDATDTTKMLNDGVEVTKTLDTTSLSSATVIKAICEINGSFGHVNRSGQFDAIRVSQADPALYPRTTLYPASTLKPVTPRGGLLRPNMYIPPLEIKKYKVSSIARVQIRTQDEDVGVVVGSESGNMYIVTGNFLCYGMNFTELSNAANNLLGAINNIVYQPFRVKASGNPGVVVGDYIWMKYEDEYVQSLIMSRTLSGVLALTDEYSSEGDPEQNKQINGLSEQIMQLKNKTAILRADVDEVSVTMTEELDDTIEGSYAYVTAQKIGAEVTRAQGAESSLSSSISATAGEISLKVSKTDIVSDLNDKMGSGITIEPNRIQIGSTGTLIVNSQNFKLDQSGNAYFSGEVKNCNIHGNSGFYEYKIGADEIKYTANDSELMNFLVDDNHLSVAFSAYGVQLYVGGEGISLSKVVSLNGATPLTSSNWQDYIPDGNTTSY